MTKTIRHFRDSLIVDLNLISSLRAESGDTIVFGARNMALVALAPQYRYVLAADTLTVASNGGISLIGGSQVTVLAASIEGALVLSCPGTAGDPGADGEDGESGLIDDPEFGRPVWGPGGAGGNGEDGGQGSPGGVIKVFYGSATQTPTGSAPGGPGGMGGRGGAGGPGRPPGRPGRGGRPGGPGAEGTVEIRQMEVIELWNQLDVASAHAWAAYRAELAGYFLRRFDFESQLIALNESHVALTLDPANIEAETIQSRIINRQIPSGLPRDLDIAPDYPGLAGDLMAEVGLVNDAFKSFVSVVSLDLIAESIREHLSVMRFQLAHRKDEAEADVVLAQQDVDIAKAEKANLQKQIDDVKEEIEKVRDRGFSLGDLVTSVGAVAGAVAGISTGVGAIISIPAALAALERVGATRDLPHLLGELNNAAKDPKNKTKFEQDIAKIKGLGGDLKDVVKGTNSMISFVKVISDLEAAMSGEGQGDTGKLLKQQAVLVRQQMVAALREKQAQTRVAASRQRVNNLLAEIGDIDQRLANWNAQIAFLTAAAEVLIRSAREVVDMVMEDVFLAQRAREIYQLEGTPDLRFDFGFLHPDVDRSLSPAQRAAASLVSLAGMPVQVLSWNKMYQQLNTAQIGFDVIHPQLSLTITDAAQLQAFGNGAALSFTIGLEAVPEGMFELKANALHIDMTGASSAQSSNIWITHSGEWNMTRRTDGSTTTMSLRPRREVFGFRAGSGTLSASIPANPQPNSEPGPPFSFWGRGIATTFRLQIAQPSVMNLANLSSIHISMDCIGFAPQVAGARVTIHPEIQVMAALPLQEALV